MSTFRGAQGRQSYGAKGVFVNGTWLCDCNPRAPAIHLMTKKAGPNQGRWFHTCQKDKEAADRCKFFLWDDDAKPREQSALLNNSRTEPGYTNDIPVRPQRAASPVSPATVVAGPVNAGTKRNITVAKEGEDDFDPQLDRAATAAETPRKAARMTDAYTTPRRKLPWQTSNEVNAIPTPQTERHVTNDPFVTRFAQPGGSMLTPSRGKEPEHEKPLTLTPDSSPLETPTPNRFKNANDGHVDDAITRGVLRILDEDDVPLTERAEANLRNLLAKHNEGNRKRQEMWQTKVTAKEKRVSELTHRNDTLQAELAEAKATIAHMIWERENGDI